MRRAGLFATTARLVVTLVCCVVSFTSAAQQSDPISSTPAFKAATRVVNVNVVVTDSHGNPITGLTKDDFELFDNDKPQEIRFFDEIRNVAPAPAPPLPPDTYTNRQPAAAVPPSVTAILFDTFKADWVTQAYALHRLRAFLRKLQPDDRIALYEGEHQYKMLHDFTQDSAELIAAIHRYDAQHTGPKGQRVKMQPSDMSELDRFLAGDDIVTALQRRARENTMVVAAHVVSLVDIARHLATAPGRKSLIWIAYKTPELLPDEGGLQRQLLRAVMDRPGAPKYHGFKAVMLGPNGLADPKDRAMREIRNGLYSGDLVPLLVRVFNDSNIAVYPVAAEGLQTRSLGFDGAPALGFNTDPGPLTGPLTGFFGVELAVDTLANMPNESFAIHGEMIELAERTGGRAYFNRNDLETGIRHALDDGNSNYELAYYPDHGDWRGEWRKIQIKIKDPQRYVPGPDGVLQEVKKFMAGGYEVKVLARGGYFALPEPKPEPSQDRRELLSKTLNSSDQATQLPLTVRLVPSVEINGQIDAYVSLDAHDLLRQQGEGHWKGSFEVLFAQLGNNEYVRPLEPKSRCCLLRRPLEVPMKSYNLDWDDATYQEALQKGILSLQKLTLRPGAITLAITVHDKNSDAVGSVRIPLEQYTAMLQPGAAPH